MLTLKRRILSLAVLVALGAAAPVVNADTVTEVEPNDSVQAAQVITSTASEVVIPAFLGPGLGQWGEDIDFYSFYAEAGDLITLDIDGGIGGAQTVDTLMGLFGPGPDYPMLRVNDDGGYAGPSNTLDTGTNSPYDSYIKDFLVPATGVYTVGVVGIGGVITTFADGGVLIDWEGNPTPLIDSGQGDYKLVITGLHPPTPTTTGDTTTGDTTTGDTTTGDTTTTDAVQITIDVKPAERMQPKPFNPKANGVVPVALMSSDTFDAMSIDPASLRFGRVGDENSLERCDSRGKGTTKGRKADRVCFFRIQDGGFMEGDLEAVLTGKTKDGTKFIGRGALKVPGHIKSQTEDRVKTKKDKKSK